MYTKTIDYQWELEFEDGTYLTRKQNVLNQKTPAHIDQQNPPKQVKRVYLRSDKSLPVLYCDIPTGAKPICYWTVIRYYNVIVDVIYNLGYELNGEKVLLLYNYKGEAI